MTKVKICMICESAFTPGKYSIKPDTCSDKCHKIKISKLYHNRAVEKYKLNPKHCVRCQSIISFEKKINKFCNSSCSAVFNNTGKLQSNSTKSAISKGLINRFKLQPRTTKSLISIRTINCEVCSNPFTSKTPSKRKTCSENCMKELLRSKRIKFLKDNAGTFNWIRKNVMNYFEQAFCDWIESNGFVKDKDFKAISYIIDNEEVNTFYILDFYFPNLKLNIELDGTHHEKEDQLLRDSIRDEYIGRTKGLAILRIKSRDWYNKSKREQIKEELLDGVLNRS